MMKSMTGYGRGDYVKNGIRAIAEVSSVNRKQCEISVNLPRELEYLEIRVRSQITKHVSRGRVNVRISMENAEEGNHSLRTSINKGAVDEYVKQIRMLSNRHKVTGDIDFCSILRLPGVLQPNEILNESERVWPLISGAVRVACKELIPMRAAEGAHLKADLIKRMKLILKSVGVIRKRAPRISEKHKKNLIEKFRKQGLKVPEQDDDRFLREVIYYLDRTDITEELTRLESHHLQFEQSLKTKGPTGRKLDFLSQEMNREINTIGSKANDSQISKEVVNLKTELEKFREQAQNVE